MPLYHRTRLVRQIRLKVQQALAEPVFDATAGLKLSHNTLKPMAEVLEEISRNISKMDQNLYAARAGMEEIRRVKPDKSEFVSLD